MYRKPPSPPPQPQGALTRGADGVYAYQNLAPKHRPVATWALMAACVALFAVQLTTRGFTERFDVNPAAVRAGEWWRIFTGAFLHGGALHIAANAYFGWAIGARLERHIGALRLLAITLVSIVGSGVAIAYLSNVPAVGFSGPLFGWLAAWLAFHVTPRFPGLRLSGPQRSAFLQMMLANFLISLLPGISMLGHAGGFVAGFASAAVLGLKPLGAPGGTARSEPRA
jgi:membrane associated rhomboid family serine protease